MMGLGPPQRCTAMAAKTGARCRRFLLSFIARPVCLVHATPEERSHNARECAAADRELAVAQAERQGQWRVNGVGGATR
ncbi:MAG: hypothetical protein M3N25_03055 [Actinomycetota bacterium]|nr:hypothetical protein [Actinomycetota bacterium]